MWFFVTSINLDLDKVVENVIKNDEKLKYRIKEKIDLSLDINNIVYKLIENDTELVSLIKGKILHSIESSNLDLGLHLSSQKVSEIISKQVEHKLEYSIYGDFSNPILIAVRDKIVESINENQLEIKCQKDTD